MQKKFIYIFWIGIFALLIYVIHSVLEYKKKAQLTPEVSQTAHKNIVTLEAINHQYMVNGYINKHPVIFLIDTGASSVSIPEAVANSIGLKKGFQQTALTAGGHTTVYHAIVDTLQIGNITLKNIKANISPAFHAEYILLGMSALKHLEIQQKNNQLILIQNY
ncbi:retroviral-like aspartic protease family protein [Thiotrichales bacterium 19S11-10]|nr:retroviral-like aspartic protease family protein [Thiotrichales bacterium 19S11-10]MCF6808246.1 retroviral-like aspartic protease family protein [Thiotrichales bacterium 19S9-11]MCF6812262.1 retroviral-like aspartic protease family protein [Thiotrichales bacterium 19S9-12]